MRNNSTKRFTRKLEHLEIAKHLEEDTLETGFNDINLIHNATSSLALVDIDISTSFLNKKINAPFLINAITGGPGKATEINNCLARVARQLNIPMAVGSQQIAIEDAQFRSSFKGVRKINPKGIILANLSALSPVRDVLNAVEMLEADGIQLHLNLPQELSMFEGDRDFKGLLENIKIINEESPVPVIAKETSFGISKEVAHSLWSNGIEYIDIGGKGGTNFATIERYRRNMPTSSVFEDWGIPTAISIAEVASQPFPVKVIASGGITNALDGIKALSLGAELIGMAGICLKVLLRDAEAGLLLFFNDLIYDFRALMLLMNVSSLDELKNSPLIITGKTKEWLEQRNILQHYFKRSNP